jgi:hypothetical protein
MMPMEIVQLLTAAPSKDPNFSNSKFSASWLENHAKNSKQ